MALFAKRTEEEKALAAARGDLAAAQKKLDATLGRQDAAAAFDDRWKQWEAARDEAASEVARLSSVVRRLEDAAEAAKREAEMAAFLKQVDACRAMQTAVYERKDEVARATSVLIRHARDTAAATAEAQRLNAILPPGIEPIAIGDFMARDLPRLPREEIATEIQTLWVNVNGVPVGDQDAVIEREDGKGSLQVNRTTHMFCTKRKFRSTTFRPAFVADHPGYFFSALRLPFVDRAGLAFDGSAMVLQQVAALDVDLPPPPRQVFMPARTELVPIDPCPPADAAPGEADRAVVV